MFNITTLNSKFIWPYIIYYINYLYLPKIAITIFYGVHIHHITRDEMFTIL